MCALATRRTALARIAALAGATAFAHPLTRAAGPLPGGWPSRPVRLIIPAPAGSMVDTLARLIGNHLANAFGQPFVADNKPGATGNIGTMALLQAPADGHALMFTVASFTVTVAALRPEQQPYDLLRDLAPIAQVGVGGVFLGVTPQLQVKSMQELFELVRKEPGKHAYGSGGIGSTGHLIMTSLLSQRGLQMIHVPYNTSADVVREMIGGRLQVGSIEPVLLTTAQADKVRALAVASTIRAPRAPDIPTLSEVGIPWNLDGFLGLFARAGTPLPIVNALNAEVNQWMRTDDGKARLLALNAATPTKTTAEDFQQMLRRDLPVWRKIVVDNAIS